MTRIPAGTLGTDKRPAGVFPDLPAHLDRDTVGRDVRAHALNILITVFRDIHQRIFQTQPYLLVPLLYVRNHNQNIRL